MAQQDIDTTPFPDNWTGADIAAALGVAKADIAELYALLAAGGGTASGGTSSSSPTLLSNAQVFNLPTGPIPTSSVQPTGVTLANPASNTLDATFGMSGTSGVTIPDRTAFNKVFANFNDEGAFATNPTSYPSQGASGNWVSVYRTYAEYMSDGVTPDPRNLLVRHPDYWDFIARSTMQGSFDTSPFEQAYARPAVGMTPGSYMELCCRWPSISRDGISARWSWPTFWLFELWELFGTTTTEYGPNQIEIDAPDGFPEDDSVPGLSGIVTGTPTYNGNTSVYGTVTDQVFGVPGYRPGGVAGGTGGSGRLYPDGPQWDPTQDFHVFAVELRDADTVVFRIDGVVVRVRKIQITDKDSSGNYIPFRIEVSHQFGCKFNPKDLAALNAYASPVRAAYSIRWLRVWNSVGTDTLPSTSSWTPPVYPTGGTLSVTGQVFGHRDVSGGNNASLSGGGALPFVANVTYRTSTDNTHKFYQNATTGTSPVGKDGSWVWRLQAWMPNSDLYQFGVGASESTSNSQFLLTSLYPKGYDGYMVLQTPNLSASPFAATDMDFGGMARPGFWKLVRSAGTLTLAGSVSGKAGSWEVVATGNNAYFGLAHDFDEVFAFVNPADSANAQRDGRLIIEGWEVTTSTDPQAASAYATA